MPTYDVVIKSVPAMRVASIRDTIPTYAEQGDLWDELYAYLGQNRVAMSGPCFTLYHDKEFKERDVDAEVCQSFDGALKGNARVQVYDLPAVAAMASIIHHGPFNTLHQAYSALGAWIQANEYRICGPDREIYIQSGEPVRQDDPSYVTEIQMPVEKV